MEEGQMGLKQHEFEQIFPQTIDSFKEKQIISSHPWRPARSLSKRRFLQQNYR